MSADDEELSFKDKLLLIGIGDLAEICKTKCDIKYLGTLLYMSLRFFNITWEDADDYLKNIGLMSSQAS